MAFDPSFGAIIAANAAAAAGITGDALVMAVAIAGAESSFRFDARGDADLPEKGCGSYGLWQINSCPERDAGSTVRYGDRPELLYNPVVNARSMAAISSGGTNWQPWTVFKTGAYRKHIIEASQAVKKIDPKRVAEWAAYDAEAPPTKQSNDIGFSIKTPFGTLSSDKGLTGKAADVINTGKDAVDAIKDPLAALGTFFQALLDPKTWLRAAGLIVALVLVALGLNFIMTDLGYGVSPAALAKVAM